MNLDIDKQTLNDLSIFDNPYQRHSIFNLFNNARTIGGREKLEEIFKKPLTDPAQIKERVAVLEYLYKHDVQFEADKNACDFAEFYLTKHYYNRPFSVLTGFLDNTIFRFNNSNYYTIQKGVESVLSILHELWKYACSDPTLFPAKLKKYHSIINQTLQEPDLITVKTLFIQRKLNAAEIAKTDHLFRQTAFERIKILLNIVYELDVYQSVAISGKRLYFSLPEINTGTERNLVLNGLFHPFLKEPVSNDLEFNTAKNVCFITGTNMAGKSTLLKSIGISIYLSQLGFPVPATYMRTSGFNGLITTINLSDDVDMGHSHFYAEVLRVKQVAQKINSSDNLFVVFDELFRGTNVKDAYDASLAIISAFAKVKTCFFVVSTHIVEVAHELRPIENVEFRYMETTFENDTPANSYQLRNGITEERVGVWIVKNEKIVELIEDSLLRHAK